MFINSPSDLERAAARASASRSPHLPLIRAAADGRVDFVFITDPVAVWPRRIERSNRPAIVIVGADMGADTDPQPDTWRCLHHVRTWCRFLVLHAAGAEPQHYRHAVSLAELHGRLALIEATPRTAQAWTDAIRHPPERSLLIWPRDGRHPVRPGVAH